MFMSYSNCACVYDNLSNISYCQANCSGSQACCVLVTVHLNLLHLNVYCDAKATIIVTTTVVYVYSNNKDIMIINFVNSQHMHASNLH